MRFKCAYLVLGLLVSGCDSLGFPRLDPIAPVDGAVDGTLDGAIADDAPDGGSMISRGQLVTPDSADVAEMSVQIQLTPGNVVIVVPYWNNRLNTMEVTDTTGQTWTPLDQQSITSGCSRGTNMQMFYSSITSSGTTSVKARQLGGTGLMGMFVVEYRGIAGAALDATAGKVAQTASNEMTTGPLTMSGPGVLVAAFHDSVGGGEMIPGPGLAALARETSAYSMLAHMTAEAGEYQPTANLPDSRSDACWVATALALRRR